MASQELRGLTGLEEPEPRLNVEAAERCLVDAVHEGGRSGEDTGEALHLCQHLVHLGHFPAAMGAAPVLQEAVDLIDEENGVLAFGLREGSGNVLFALSYPHRDEVGSALDEDWHIELAREPTAIGALA